MVIGACGICGLGSGTTGALGSGVGVETTGVVALECVGAAGFTGTESGDVADDACDAWDA